ncbi:MAG: hypothetical protein HZB42_08860 [Sphingobacteriales bacterium]|nr:hypothetical protein [Sphingobacteriales bacterium]
MSVIRRLSAVIILSFLFITSDAQTSAKEIKPYKVFSSGKRITVKSNRNIQHVMLWTTSGHRAVEQREINAGSFTFAIPITDKIFFLMVAMDNGKIYTEKIGIQ